MPEHASSSAKDERSFVVSGGGVADPKADSEAEPDEDAAEDSHDSAD